jgi:hypothetical protein
MSGGNNGYLCETITGPLVEPAATDVCRIYGAKPQPTATFESEDAEAKLIYLKRLFGHEPTNATWRRFREHIGCAITKTINEVQWSESRTDSPL